MSDRTFNVYKRLSDIEGRLDKIEEGIAGKSWYFVDSVVENIRKLLDELSEATKDEKED